MSELVLNELTGCEHTGFVLGSVRRLILFHGCGMLLSHVNALLLLLLELICFCKMLFAEGLLVMHCRFALPMMSCWLDAVPMLLEGLRMWSCCYALMHLLSLFQMTLLLTWTNVELVL